jgi:hypothetical protein
MHSSGPYTSDDLQQALSQTAERLSIPIRSPRWVKPTWWDWPLTEMRTRPIPAASGWVDLISITLGKQPGLAPDGYSARLLAFVSTGQNDPLTTGMLYRFVRNGQLMNDQEFDITNTIEKNVMRYSGIPDPWPAFGRKIFLNLTNNSQLILQVNNPGVAPQIAIAALYGYYYPNLGDLTKGSLESGYPAESERG